VKTLRELLPLGIGLALFGAAEAYFLGNRVEAGKWLLAGFLVGHGLVHGMFFTPQPKEAAARGVEYPFDLAKSRLTTVLHLDTRLVRSVAIGLLAVVIVGFALAGLSTVGFVVPTGWWTGLVAGAALVSALLLVVGFNRGLALGFAIDAALLWLAIGGAWAPGTR
jgi:hypothetical protein